MVLIAGIAYAAKSLTAGGAIEAFFMGIIILWATGFSGFFLFFLFFISCTIVGKISKSARSSFIGKEVAERRGTHGISCRSWQTDSWLSSRL
ncbi:MAG: DUF92 domain-containing protein [Spirochaetales bacterium]|nr:DUF92 domain-containing protein [Spirochaetales bacterium]